MKKEWINPQIIQLGVDKTESGTKYNPQADGQPWTDDEAVWHTPTGYSWLMLNRSVVFTTLLILHINYLYGYVYKKKQKEMFFKIKYKWIDKRYNKKRIQ